MNDLIDRYIYDVTRRLPESERGEIKRELDASISDMLPDNPSKQDIVDVLTNLGAPYLLAEQYRQKPRYLISPAIFDTYITVLKTVAAIVAVVSCCIGAVLSLSSGSVAEVIAGGITMAFEVTLQTALWITIGFVIAERRGYKQKWSPADLPPLPTGITISRSSSITGMIVSVFIPALFITLITNGKLFFSFVRGVNIINVFSQSAMERFVPYLIVIGVLGFVVNVFRLIWAKWNIPICVMNIVYNVVWVGIVIYALNWPDLLSTGILDFMSSKIGEAVNLNIFITVFSILLIIPALVDIVTGIRNTWLSMRKSF